MFDPRGYVFERLLEVLDKEERKVANSALDSAIKAVSDSKGKVIKPEDLNPDDIQRHEDKITAALNKCEDLVKFFKNSVKSKDDFLKNFKTYQHECLSLVNDLREKAKEIKEIQSKKQRRDKYRFYANLVGALGDVLLTVAWLGFPVLALPGMVISGAAKLYIGYDAVFNDDEIKLLQKKLEEANDLFEKESEGYSGKRWFTHSDELERVLGSMMDTKVFEQMAKKVEGFTKELEGEDMTDDEFKKNYEVVLDYCMGLMAKDGRMIAEYGKELAPAVMTFVFVVCLLNENNRIVLNCSLKTNLSLSLSGLCSGFVGIGWFFSDIFPLIGICLHAVCALLHFWDSNEPCAEQIEKINQAANDIEARFLYIENVYKDAEKYKSDEVAEWQQLLISGIPNEAGELDIKEAVKAYLPQEAQGRIRTLKLDLKEVNNWLVGVPTRNSQELSQLKEIEIKGKNCKIE